MRSIKPALILLLVFIIFSYFVITGSFTQIDKLITISLQSHLTKAFDTPLSFLSLFGTVEVTSIILFVILGLLKWRRSLVALITFGIGTGLELLGKIYLFHPDPPKAFLRFDLPIFLPSGLVQTGNSYPSGHTFRAAFLFVLALFLIQQTKNLSKQAKTVLSFLCLLFLVLMLVSRVSLGEHWTTDVIGGLLLGFGLGYLTLFLFEKKRLVFLPKI